ncbi:MAG: hypothetical protein IPL23_22535 [Saprospiraceae bacterium]|nr:hypothetical protein [Saprospiraceae bacterium]
MELSKGCGTASSKDTTHGQAIIKEQTYPQFWCECHLINWLLKLVRVPDVQSSKVEFFTIYKIRLTYWLNNGHYHEVAGLPRRKIPF